MNNLKHYLNIIIITRLTYQNELSLLIYNFEIIQLKSKLINFES